MKFTASTAALQKALSIVSPITSSKSPMSILECVLIEAYDKEIRLTGTDLSISATITVDGMVSDPGCAAIRGKLFEDVVKRMPDGQITVNVNDKHRFTVQADEIKTSLSGVDAADFPERKTVEETSKISVPQAMLHDMISKVESCIAKDDIRPVLTGGYLELEKGRLTMVGMDGFRMAVKSTSGPIEPTGLKAIIPWKSLAMLKKLISPSSEELVTLMFDKNAFEVVIDDAELHCTLIAEEYVKWRTVVPQAYNTEVTVDASRFRDAIDRASLIARLGNSKLIKLTVNDDGMTISASSDVDEMIERIDAEKTGADISIAFNVAFVVDMIRTMPEGNIIFKMVKNVHPCVVKHKDDDEYFCLLLPVRTSA